MAQDNKTYTSNTLWNDSTGLMAYTEQLKDGEISWSDNSKKYNGSYPDPTEQDPSHRTPYIPTEWKTEGNKFQSKLNEFFLNHWADWQAFLNEKDLDPSTINTWKELEEFLDGIYEDDPEALTLLGVIRNAQLLEGYLHVGMDSVLNPQTGIPGLMIATSNVTTPNISHSYIDDKTGIIKLVFDITI